MVGVVGVQGGEWDDSLAKMKRANLVINYRGECAVRYSRVVNVVRAKWRDTRWGKRRIFIDKRHEPCDSP